MAPMRALRSALGLACLLAFVSLAVAGCGGGGSTSSRLNGSAESGKSRPAPPKSAFPATEGRTLKQFYMAIGKVPPTIKVSPGGEAFWPGEGRYPFLVNEKALSSDKLGREVPDAEIAIYLAEGKAQTSPWQEPVIGPFPARIESLATKPPFQGKTTTENPEMASVVYSSQLPFPSEGTYKPIMVTKEKGGWATKGLPTVQVGEFEKIPRPGEKAPLIQTPTARSVGGARAELSTRVPPDTQNQVNYADVLGKEPILLLFTTPKFCQSRACGPVVDVAEQAQHEFEGKANFIHMEIYNDNDPSKGVRPQVRRFHLPTEPWLFAINREGVVSASIEGAFGTKLMRQTVDRVISE